MISRKISKSRKYSKVSSRKKNYSKVQKGGTIEYKYLHEGVWVDAHPHQIEAMNIIQGQAEKINLQRRIAGLPEISNPIPEVLHEYNKNGIVFHIRLLYRVNDNNEYVFEMIRDDGSKGYLKKTGASRLGERMGNH
jgi:hypothetical protein